MATLSQLVGALARVSNVPEATIFAYGRFAREAGLIAQKGRGRGAAIMSASDAANLLIAVGGTDVTREAAPAIHEYRPMKAASFRNSQETFLEFARWCQPLGLEPTNELPKSYVERSWRDDLRCVSKGDFGSLVEFLITKAGRDELTPWLASLPNAGMETGFLPAIYFVFHRWAPSVSVHLANGRGTMLEINFKHKGRLQPPIGIYSNTTVTNECLTGLGAALIANADPSSFAVKSISGSRKERPKAL